MPVRALGTVAAVPDVDVVIVSYNSAGELRRCVDPLTRQPDIHVIVVDSASSDASLDTIADLRVASVPLTANRGFAHGCNAGWRIGVSPYVLFLNPDAAIDGDSVRRLVAVAEQDATVGIVAPRIVEPDGTLDFSQRRFPRLRTTYAQALFLHRLFPRADWSDEVIRDAGCYERRASPDWASGACLLMPRPLLERLNGLDDGFFLYCEDLDLCRRVRGEGLDVRFEPAAVAVHEGGQSAPRTALIPVLAASRVRYASKHLSPARAVAERLGIALGAVTHTVVTRGGAAARRGNLRALRRALSPRRSLRVDEAEKQA
jgi:N-acetylglucosaminyl-diphospho-decaprenol L-rhamnosyltransferase